MTWAEYIEQTVKRINDSHAKHILLHLSQHNDQEFTPRDLKEQLNLPISENKIQERLQELVKSDLIEEGSSDIDYHGLKDGTLNLVLRNRFQKEILSFEPNFVEEFRQEIDMLKKDKQRLIGQLSNIVGKTAELQLMSEFRSNNRFKLSTYFQNVSDDHLLNIMNVKTRFYIQRPDGKNMEIDVIAESDCGRVVLVEVKKMSKPAGISLITHFIEKINVYSDSYPQKTVLSAFFSLGGFTDEAMTLCQSNKIATTDKLTFIF